MILALCSVHQNPVCTFPVHYTCTCPDHLNLSDSITQLMLNEEYRSPFHTTTRQTAGNTRLNIHRVKNYNMYRIFERNSRKFILNFPAPWRHLSLHKFAQCFCTKLTFNPARSSQRHKNTRQYPATK